MPDVSDAEAFEEWCQQLQTLAVEQYGTITDWQSWRDYFDEGHTPSEAISLDLQQA